MALNETVPLPWLTFGILACYHHLHSKQLGERKICWETKVSEKWVGSVHSNWLSECSPLSVHSPAHSLLGAFIVLCGMRERRSMCTTKELASHNLWTCVCPPIDSEYNGNGIISCTRERVFMNVEWIRKLAGEKITIISPTQWVYQSSQRTLLLWLELVSIKIRSRGRQPLPLSYASISFTPHWLWQHPEPRSKVNNPKWVILSNSGKKFTKIPCILSKYKLVRDIHGCLAAFQDWNREEWANDRKFIASLELSLLNGGQNGRAWMRFKMNMRWIEKWQT